MKNSLLALAAHVGILLHEAIRASPLWRWMRIIRTKRLTKTLLLVRHELIGCAGRRFPV